MRLTTPSSPAPASAGRRLRVLLINPLNELVAITNTRDNFWNQFRIWKPLGLMVLAGRTPKNWDIEIIDENLGAVDYDAIQRPDLVGISAFTSQANAAYALADRFRAQGIPVVIGGVHATMRTEEASTHVDAVVTGEGDDVWEQVLADVQNGGLKKIYAGGFADMTKVPAARHDLLSKGYAFGSIQVSRGCPINCSFCSVTEFNGKRLRSRPIEDVVEEMKQIKEYFVLIADDNLIGTSKKQIAYAKDLFRALAASNHGKKWMGQVTINFADDEELMQLAFKSGCFGMLIGFESPTADGLKEVNKNFNTKNGRNLRDSVKRIQKNRIMVAGSFVLGLDVDRKGIGRRIAEAGHRYGIDIINTLYLTPLPGTRLFKQMDEDDRLVANNFPDDWKYYTFTYPVSKYKHLAWPEAIQEMYDVNRYFYSFPRIAHRLARALFRTRTFLSLGIMAATNLSYRFNRKLELEIPAGIDLSRETAYIAEHAGVDRQNHVRQGLSPALVAEK